MEVIKMPGGDRTGPLGAGAMSGRGLGFCSGSSGIMPRGGRFYGAGYRQRFYGNARGSGRGFAGVCRFAGIPYPEYDDRYIDKEKILKDQVDFLEEELKIAKEQLQSFEDKSR